MAAKKTTIKTEEVKAAAAETAAPVKSAAPAKAEAAKTEPVKAEAAKAEPAKKTRTKKAAAPAEEKKPAASKASAKKAEGTKVEVFVEYNGVQVPLTDIIERVKTNNVKAANDIKIYLKPEDNTAYYVADGKASQIKVYFC